jgi:penicillin-binding protein 1B
MNAMGVHAAAPGRLYSARRRRAVSILLALIAIPAVLMTAEVGRLYARYREVVDRRLVTAAWTPPVRLYSRPFTIRRGASLSPEALVRRLNALSYDQKPSGVPGPGQFVVGEGMVTLRSRSRPDDALLVFFDRGRVADVRGYDSHASRDTESLEPELITDLDDGPRSKRRRVRMADLPDPLVKCVLAAEDRRFFQHPGLDLPRTVAAALRNVEAEGYIQGGSTITQQLVKNFFLTPQKAIRRKLQEAMLAFVLERRAGKARILEMYLNEVYLGQVGSFSVHGMGEGARLYFDKDVGNLSLAEAALLAGLIQSPNRYNPYRHPEDARVRRNLVLQAAQQAGFVPAARARTAIDEPVHVVRETLEGGEAPYFVDLVRDQLAAALGPRRAALRGLQVQTTLDPYLQSLAQESLVTGLHNAENPRAANGRKAPPPHSVPLQGSVVVMDPRSGAILALVGGRSYETTQFDRATQARRQPGSTFKPFVYLTAFESTFDDPERPPITPGTLVEDEPTRFFTEHGDEYLPTNDHDRYLGVVTLRRALSLSLNSATLRLADYVGFDRIARLFSRVIGREVKPYPALALGALETTPLEMATAYSVLASGGLRPSPVTWTEVKDAEGHPVPIARLPPERLVRAESAFVVTHMLRSVLDEGTGAAARRMGFRADAAGKTGTTNETRDAWFIGYTPDLLCAVWVGYDDNTPLRLSGAEAALPIWVEFMKKALAGTKPRRFTAPDGVVFASIDKETGLLATPSCPHPFNEAFIAGAVPLDYCPWHGDASAGRYGTTWARPDTTWNEAARSPSTNAAVP